MKNFKLENITLEISTAEVLIIKDALEHYRDTRIDSVQAWSEADDEFLQRMFGMDHVQRNIVEHERIAKQINEMIVVLRDAFNGYPFKD